MDFDNVKHWLESNAIRGGLLALVSLVLGILFKGEVPVSAQDLYEGAMNLLTALGTVWALIGRLTANTKLVASTAEVTAYRAARLNQKV